MVRIDPLVTLTPGTGSPQPLLFRSGSAAFNKLRLQASNANTGVVYIGLGPNMSKASAIAELMPGATDWFGDEAHAIAFDTGNLYAMADNGTDVLKGAGFQR